METLKTIAYISRTSVIFSQPMLDHLLQDAQKFNAYHDVTGVLLHNPGFFFQYIEGPSASIEKVYRRIKSSTRHEAIFELYNDVSPQRYFEGWNMGFCRAPHGLIQELSHQAWIRQLNALSAASPASDGLQMLITFWQNMASDAQPKLHS